MPIMQGAPRDPRNTRDRELPDRDPQHAPVDDPDPADDSDAPIREPDEPPAQSALLFHGLEFGGP